MDWRHRQDGIEGQRYVLMLQSTPNANKVVEVHAINLLKAEGVNASVKWNASTTKHRDHPAARRYLDGYSEAVAGGVSAVKSGVPLVDFALAQPRQDYIFLAHKGINTLADLKGKKIGVQDTTGVNYAQALLVLQKAGLKASDVSIIAVGGQSTRLPALVAGRVDATMLSHSAESSVKGTEGFNTLFDYTKEASNLYDDNIFATKDWLDKTRPGRRAQRRPAQVVRLVQRPGQRRRRRHRGPGHPARGGQGPDVTAVRRAARPTPTPTAPSSTSRCSTSSGSSTSRPDVPDTVPTAQWVDDTSRGPVAV